MSRVVAYDTIQLSPRALKFTHYCLRKPRARNPPPPHLTSCGPNC
jgi:hypothetical protein